MAKLKTHVHVHDDEHGTVVFPAGTDRDDLPGWAQAKIGAHAFDGDFDSAGDTPSDYEDDPSQTPVEPVDLNSMKRGQLDEYARSIGVEEPEKLPNIQAVKDAIVAATGPAKADSS